LLQHPLHAVGGVVGGLRGADQHDGHVPQGPGHHVRRQRRGDGVVVLRPALQRPHVGLQLALFDGQAADLTAQVVEHRAVELGGAEQHPERQCQEHRDQGDDVVPEVDHDTSPRTQDTALSHQSTISVR
jgi:hypothetical protein